MSFSIRHGSFSTPDRFPLIYDLYICEIGQMSTKKNLIQKKTISYQKFVSRSIAFFLHLIKSK